MGRRNFSKEYKLQTARQVIIGATALIYGLMLTTRNVKHYPFPELEVKEI